MKKILYFAAALLATGIGFVSCGENDDFSNVHILTDDEIAEMHRQDSIDSVRRAQINADYLYDYEIDIYCSESSYDGGFLEIDYKKMAADFGISETELLHGIANMRSDYLENGPYADGAKLTGFAIQGSTHQDEMTAYNTNGIWGHWWDENGDVTAWGDNARVFLEYYEPENDGDPVGFTVGQMPGKLTPGQTVTVLEGLKYQDTRMVLQIKVNAIERGAVVANVVYEEDINVELNPNDAGSYDAIPYAFDLDAVLSATGLTSISASNLIAYNANGDLWGELNADNGFWFDKSGPIGGWGDNASCWLSYGMTEDPATIGVCLMPGATAAGDHYDHDFGFVNGNKIAMLHVHIDIIGYEDNEERPAGDPCTIEKDITMTKQFTTGYETIEFDVRDDLKEAFKMTTLEIFQAKNEGSLKIWIDAEGDGDPAYSADAPGYWLSADGQDVGWGDGIFWLSLGGDTESLYLYGGNHPGNCDPAGENCHVRYVITCNGGTAIFNVNFVVTGKGGPTADEISAATVVYTADAAVSFAAGDTYEGGVVEFDIDAVAAALGVADFSEIASVAAKEADGSWTNRCTADPDRGFWFDANGAIINYGEGAMVFINYYGLDAANIAEFPEDASLLYTGQMPNALAAGETYVVPFGFYADGKLAVVNVTMTIE